jgi:methyl halide transferase
MLTFIVLYVLLFQICDSILTDSVYYFQMSERPLSEQDAPGILSQTFAGQPPEQHGSRWMRLWDENVTPWDRGQPSPALIDLLQDKKDLVGQSWVVDPAKGKRRKRALVPGCGRGYDVLLLSAFGYDAYGLDLSESGIKAAKEYEKLHGGDDIYKAHEGIEKGKVTWMVGDFFKGEFIKAIGGDGGFDLLYDYTVRLLHRLMCVIIF